ncbi:MAG: hypothetical protein ACJ8H8_07050 [Geminicoccaceae bacterium]
MAQGLLRREPIDDFGEFRAYLRAERQEMAFEAFREGDGRAWLLRVPLAARAPLSALLREVSPMLLDDAGLSIDAGVLHQVSIGPTDQLAAVLIAEGDRRAFALWRQEQLRSGWSWTVDVVVVPVELAHRLCGLVLQVIERMTASP